MDPSNVDASDALSPLQRLGWNSPAPSSSRRSARSAEEFRPHDAPQKLLAFSLFLTFARPAPAQDQNSTDGGHTYTLSRGGEGTSRTAATLRENRGRRPDRIDPIVLDFNALPASPWLGWDCLDYVSSATIAGGILTIDATSCYEFLLFHPDPWHPYGGIWHDWVDNSVGWAIESRLKVDPATADVLDIPYQVPRAFEIWADDHTNLVIVGFNTNAIGLAYPDHVRVPMNTTDDFHVYRIKSKLDRVRIYVDGRVVLNHKLSWGGRGTDALGFGDGYINSRSISYWDYFLYDVSPKAVHP